MKIILHTFGTHDKDGFEMPAATFRPAHLFAAELAGFKLIPYQAVANGQSDRLYFVLQEQPTPLGKPAPKPLEVNLAVFAQIAYERNCSFTVDLRAEYDYRDLIQPGGFQCRL